MERCCAAARSLLSDAAVQSGFARPEVVPLRRKDDRGLLLSALPRRLAAENGGDAQAVAAVLAAGIAPDGTPFSRVTAENGMLLLSLSESWMRSVLTGFAPLEWPDIPALPWERNEENPLFFLAYTARRCRVLSEREHGAVPARLPAGLICALAGEGDAVDIVRSYWQLPYEVRAYAPLAKAVGVTAGLIYRKFTPFAGDARYNN